MTHSLKTILFTLFAFVLAFGLSACSGDKEGGGNSSVPTETEYTITLNANNGSGETDEVKAFGGSNITLSLPVNFLPTVGKEIFKGWGLSADADTVSYKKDDNLTVTDNLTLYALWASTSTEYTITLNANNGSGATDEVKAFGGDNITLSLPVNFLPTVGKEIFKGWGLSEDADTVSYKKDDNLTVTDNLTLYALWASTSTEYTITLNANNGSGATDEVKAFGGDNITLSLPVNFLPTVGKEIFKGWGLSEDADTVSYKKDDNLTVTDNLTLYALWAPTPTEYTITLNANNGSGETHSVKAFGGDNITLSLPVNFLPTVGKEVFKGWGLSADADTVSYKKDDNLTVTDNLTLYALWAPTEYTNDDYAALRTFEVAIPTQLISLASLGKDFDNKTIILTDDIDMSGVTDFKGFQTEFKGTFDGDNKTIKNMTINVTAERVGLIATLGSEGIVHNIHLVGGSVTGFGVNFAYVGGIVGYNYGTITNASNTGSVTGDSYNSAIVGGIVGWSEGGTITNASNSGSITGSIVIGNISGYAFVGGIVGYNKGGTITNASNTGSVTGDSPIGYPAYVGGIVGWNNTDKMTSNVYSIGSFTVTSGTPKIGGVVGNNENGSFDKAYYLHGLGHVGVGEGMANVRPAGDNTLTVSDLAFDPNIWEDKTFTGSGIINGVLTRAVLKGFEFPEYTPENYDEFTTFYVSNPFELIFLARLGKDFDNKTIILASDINMSWFTDFKGFQTEFKGTFDGDNKTIKNMTINVTAERVGLIATLGSSGIVRNIHLVGGSVTGENSFTNAYVGGIVGYNEGGTITNASNSGSVTGNGVSSYNAYVSGIVGYNKGGTITNASNTGSVTGSADSYRFPYVGGIVGWNEGGSITNASNSGSVDGSGGISAIVGGIVGYNEGSTITKASNSGSVTGSSSGNAFVGGIVGSNYGIIIKASNSGSITGSSVSGDYVCVGGIVGSNNGTIINASNSGSITGSRVSSGDVNVGGIVGWSETNQTISNVYNIGSLTVTSGVPIIGGVVGYNVKGSFDNAYYLGSLGVGGVGDGIADTLTSKDKDNFTVSALAFDPALWEDKTFTDVDIINGVSTRAVLKSIGF